MTRDSAVRALVVFAHYPERLSYFADWLDALVAEPMLDVTPANLVTPLGRRRLRRVAPDADLVVVLHSAIGDSLSEISRCEAPLGRRRGPMAAFIGNEVSLPGRPLRAKVELLRRLQPDVIGTQLLVDAAATLYADVPGAKVVPMPHALNPTNFHPTAPNDERSIEVGFRGGRYPKGLGESDRDRIVDYFATTRFQPPLATDVRIDASYGRRAWAGFLNRCKATIGAESGARELRLEMPTADVEAASSWRARLWPAHRYLPRPVKTALRRGANRFAPPVTGGPGTASTAPATADSVVTGKCISSRHFDAIGTETCQILFPGRYNDLLEADRHYLCLDRDFANIDDVLARFRDVPYRLTMVREAREWALDGETYPHRVRSLLRALGMG
jgi:hypothetical protein